MILYVQLSELTKSKNKTKNYSSKAHKIRSIKKKTVKKMKNFKKKTQN